jgi:hypothetical protein
LWEQLGAHGKQVGELVAESFQTIAMTTTILIAPQEKSNTHIYTHNPSARLLACLLACQCHQKASAPFEPLRVNEGNKQPCVFRAV